MGSSWAQKYRAQCLCSVLSVSSVPTWSLAKSPPITRWPGGGVWVGNSSVTVSCCTPLVTGVEGYAGHVSISVTQCLGSWGRKINVGLKLALAGKSNPISRDLVLFHQMATTIAFSVLLNLGYKWILLFPVLLSSPSSYKKIQQMLDLTLPHPRD